MKRFLFLGLLLLPASARATLVITSSVPVVFQGQTFTFQANAAVTWSCPGCAGSVDPVTGIYTAPSVVTAKQSYGGYQLLPNDHIFNTPIDSLSVSTNSAAWIASLTGANPGLNYLSEFPVNFTGPSTPIQQEVFYYTPGANGPFQLPTYPDVRIQGGWLTASLSGVDRHLITIDSTTGAFGEIYDPYPAGTNVIQSCPLCTGQSGVKFGSATYVLPPLATDAAGLYFTPLILRLQEMENAIASGGDITHALRFTLTNNYIVSSHLWPATSQAVSVSGIIPYGARFRLKSSFNISGYSSIAQILLRQAKKYGIILGDGGIDFQVPAEYTRWPIPIRNAFQEILNSAISYTNWEVVDESPLEISAYSGATTQSEHVCATDVSLNVACQQVSLVGVAVNLPKDYYYIKAGMPAQQLTAQAINGSATWSMNPTGGVFGSITSGGLYTPPVSLVHWSSTTVKAVSTLNPNAVAQMMLTVLPDGDIHIIDGKTTNFTDSHGQVWQPSTADDGQYIAANNPSCTYSFTDSGLYQTPYYSYQDQRFDLHVPNGYYKITGKFLGDPNITTTFVDIEQQGHLDYSNVNWGVAAGVTAGVCKPVDFVSTASVTNGILSYVLRNAHNSLNYPNYPNISALIIATTTAPGISAWASDGGDKIPRECFYPHCLNYSSSTLSRTWDGITAQPFSAENQTAHMEVIAYNNSSFDAPDLTVAMSSLTCSSGLGIANTVQASSLTVTSSVGRPIQVFNSWYIQNLGMSVFPYARDEYEERQYPLDLRVPCTVNGSNQCLPNSGPTHSWISRKFHNMYLPMAWVPNEEFAPVSTSSYTIQASSSMAFWVDMYVSSGNRTSVDVCSGTFNIYQDGIVSTSVPVALKVYPFNLPAQPSFMDVVYLGNSDSDHRIAGNGFPSLPLTGTYLTAVNNVSQLFKAHNMIPANDSPDHSTDDYPSRQGSKQLDGTLYTSANGYANSRGIGVGDPFYFVGGAYEGWANNPNFSQTVTAQFCAQVSSWSLNLSAYPNLKYAALYGQDEVADQTTNEKWATWLTTACSQLGVKIQLFATDDLPELAANAPNIAFPASVTVFGNGIQSSSATWQSDSDSYQLNTSSLVFRYNDTVFGQGANVPYEEEGYVPTVNYWHFWRKLCPTGVCRGGHFQWEGNYWTNSDSGGGCGNGGTGGGTGGNLQDLYNNPCTFGYDTGSDSVWGRSGFDRSQGDGVLAYPGYDSVYHNPSFGFLGAIAGVNLKSIRQGNDDIDYLNMAYAVDPSSTTNIVNEVISRSLWEVTCQLTSDCSYSWGDRSWSYGADTWVKARERLAQIIARGRLQAVKILSGKTTLKGFTWIK